jgi:hypothetical protein
MRIAQRVCPAWPLRSWQLGPSAECNRLQILLGLAFLRGSSIYGFSARVGARERATELFCIEIEEYDRRCCMKRENSKRKAA